MFFDCRILSTPRSFFYNLCNLLDTRTSSKQDYEIYKEVMEAAMVRMQQELEVYAEENATIRTSKEKDDRSVKKHRE